MNAIVLIGGLTLVGAWLEGINGGDDGPLDRFFTSLSLAGVGCVIALVERWPA